MSEQTVSWRTKQISSVCKELKQELHDILILFLIAVVLPATTESPILYHHKLCLWYSSL